MNQVKFYEYKSKHIYQCKVGADYLNEGVQINIPTLLSFSGA